MRIACPDPATFMRWQGAMTQIGIALPVALALFAVMVWAARPAGWRLRATCGLCAALAVGAVAGAFIMRARLDGAAARLTRWIPAYPQDCDLGSSYGIFSPLFVSAEHSAAGIVGLAEQAAALEATVAALVIIALLRCVVALARAARLRDMRAANMTLVMADS